MAIAQEAFLGQERVHGIEVVSHDPGVVDVRGGRHHVGDEDRRTPAGLNLDQLVMHRVTAGALDADAGQHLAVALDELEDAGLLERHEILRQIARAVPLVRVRRVFPLRPPDEIAGARKPRPQRIAVTHGETTGVIEVKMGGNDDVDVRGGEASLRKRVVEIPRTVDRVDLDVLGPHLVADARVDEHVSGAGANEQRAKTQLDPIAIIGRRALLHSGLGTTPNMAPPSRRKKPSDNGNRSKEPRRIQTNSELRTQNSERRNMILALIFFPRMQGRCAVGATTVLSSKF